MRNTRNLEQKIPSIWAAVPDADAQQIARFKRLTEQMLPALAQQQHWHIRRDHCFKRICLDYAFGDVWHHHLSKPAERHLTAEPLARALRCAEDLAANNLTLLRARNKESLRYRGRL